MNRRDTQSGFTLVETLVALAIVVLSMGVLFRIISTNLDRTRAVRNEAAAAALAQSLLAQAQTGTPRSASGVANGYAWTVRVTPASGLGDAWPVDAVNVAATVSWRDGGVHARTLTGLRVLPKALP
ncbi:MAG TPA: type II secretion system protein [Rhizomicrobium sp.]|jgi:general secretion pathway protein I